MTGLINPTATYLRIVFELEESGVIPLQSRIVERLGHAAATVAGTVGRMQRDGLVVFGDRRRVELTLLGWSRAVEVVRKHRLAERFLVDVIGLEWEHAHHEACGWEHVMSTAVERKLVVLLNHPAVSPFGNPIPGLAQLHEPAGTGETVWPPVPQVGGWRLDAFARQGGGRARVRRIGEHAQDDVTLMIELSAAGIGPGATVDVAASRRIDSVVEIFSAIHRITVAPGLAYALLVEPTRTALVDRATRSSDSDTDFTSTGSATAPGVAALTTAG